MLTELSKIIYSSSLYNLLVFLEDSSDFTSETDCMFKTMKLVTETHQYYFEHCKSILCGDRVSKIESLVSIWNKTVPLILEIARNAQVHQEYTETLSILFSRADSCIQAACGLPQV